MLAGGESGPAIVTGDADASYLVERVRTGEMPPGNHRVPDHQIETLVQWIKQGAQTVITNIANPKKSKPGFRIEQNFKEYDQLDCNTASSYELNIKIFRKISI